MRGLPWQPAPRTRRSLEDPGPRSARLRQREVLRANLALLVVSFIWGTTFVMVKRAVEAVEPFTFLAIRFAIAGAATAVMFRHRLAAAGRACWAGGCAAGALLFAGYALQTYGLQLTSSTKAGFLTGLSVVVVPLAAWPLLRQRPTGRVLFAASLATLGLALLSIAPGAVTALAPGDALVALCAVAFGLQMIVLGAVAPREDPWALAAIQILCAAALSGAAAVAVDDLSRPVPVAVWGAALFTGVLATAFGFAVQTRAQAVTTPADTAILLTTEPVFAAMAGVSLSGDTLSPRGWLGAGMILVSTLVVAVSQVGRRGRAREGGAPEPGAPPGFT